MAGVSTYEYHHMTGDVDNKASFLQRLIAFNNAHSHNRNKMEPPYSKMDAVRRSHTLPALFNRKGNGYHEAEGRTDKVTSYASESEHSEWSRNAAKTKHAKLLFLNENKSDNVQVVSVTSESISEIPSKSQVKEVQPVRRVSFKTRGPGVPRKMTSITKTTLSSSKVAELANRFNQLEAGETHNSMVARRVSSIKHGEMNRIARKNSYKCTIKDGSDSPKKIIVKMHHNKIEEILKEMHNGKVRRVPSVKLNIGDDNKTIKLSAKSRCDSRSSDSIDGRDEKERRIVKRKHSFSSSSLKAAPINVKATIEIFESNKEKTPIDSNKDVSLGPPILSKPKVPDKKGHLHVKTKDIVVRDGKRKIKILKTESISKTQKPAVVEKSISAGETQSGTEIKDQIEKNNQHSISLKADDLINDDTKIKMDNKTDEVIEHSKIDVAKDSKPVSKYGKLYDKLKLRPTFLSNKTAPLTIDKITKDINDTLISNIKEKIKKAPYEETHGKKENRSIHEEQTIDLKLEDEKNEIEPHLNEDRIHIDKKNVESAQEESIFISDEEKHYQEVTLKMKPNNSFLFSRSVSKTNEDSYSPYEFYNHSRKSLSVDNITYKPCWKENYIKEPLLKETHTRSFQSIVEKTDDLIGNLNEDSLLENDLAETINTSTVQVIESEIRNENNAIVKETELLPVTNTYDSEFVGSMATMEEDGYEPLNPLPDTKTEIVDPAALTTQSENIYQCLNESTNESDSTSIHSYEYCENIVSYEEVDHQSDDGYEYCHSPIVPEPLPPRNNCKIVLPPPKRCSVPYYELSKSESDTSAYEKMCSLYEAPPPRPPKSPSLGDVLRRSAPLPPRYNEIDKAYLRGPYRLCDEIKNYDECNENIYDTVKHIDADDTSNCYESITGSPAISKKMIHQKRNSNSSGDVKIRHDLCHSESGSTLSSDQKTNSLYGAPGLVGGNGYHSKNDNVSTPSETGGSDKSDEWMDMSDSEDNSPAIVIVRDRARVPRSPSWSRKVRDQWTKQAIDTIFVSSASAHYLITDNNRHGGAHTLAEPQYVNAVIIDANQRYKETIKLSPKDFEGLAACRLVVGEGNQRECQEVTLFVGEGDLEHHYETLSPDVTPVGRTVNADDSDSFDSDSDSEDSSTRLHHNDSGVEMGGMGRLPDPPQGSQVYALTRFATAAGRQMQKLRRNWSLKKSDISKSLSKIAKKKSTTDLSQVEEKPLVKSITRPPPPIPNQNDDQYQNTSFPFGETSPKVSEPAKAKFDKRKEDDPYENTEFHSPRTPTNMQSQYVSVETSEAEPKIEGKQNGDDSLSRRKYWSFKSKFRRSMSATPDALSGSASGATMSPSKSTFYLTDSVDVDSGFSTGSDGVSSPDTKQPVAPSRRKSRTTSMPDPNQNNSSGGIRSSIGTRPQSPPPPPPPNEPKRPAKAKREKNGPGTSSWYAEVGLFKTDANQVKPEMRTDARERSSSTSWYAEVGLYQPSNNSTTSSSSQSTAHDSGADSGHYETSNKENGDQTHRFQDEPLYQFYNAAKLESVCRELASDSDTDGYEEIGSPDGVSEKTNAPPPRPPRPSAMQLVSPQGPSRTLWCEIPEVITSAVLSTLTPHQRRLQEAKFELVTSEASYLNSLKLLQTHFILNPLLANENVLTKSEKTLLFANVTPVQRCSERLLGSLERCWQDNILLRGLCDIVRTHAERHFRVYVTYCEQQLYLDRTLKRLKEQRGRFAEALQQLESGAACQGLSLHSFLMLPMQRVTRLPLLVDAVLRRLEQDDDEYLPCQMALTILNKIVGQCNEGARRTEQTEELSKISRQIEFPSVMTPIAILPAGQLAPSRHLVRSGELTNIIWRGEDAKLTFGKKFTKILMHVFLFSDLIVLTKKNSEDSYIAFDHCPRSLIQVTGENVDGTSLWPVKDAQSKHLLLLTLLENCDGRTVEMLMSCPSETDKQRWLEALSPPSSDNPDETVYGEWDCPQVVGQHPYSPKQPDELHLEIGDVVNVTRKMADGWYHGERIRDGAKGWFPGNYSTEVASAHVRARNLKLRYRFIALHCSYIESQKKK